MKHGHGIWEDKDSKYKGNWVEDKRHGKGWKCDSNLNWYSVEYDHG